MYRLLLIYIGLGIAMLSQVAGAAVYMTSTPSIGEVFRLGHRVFKVVKYLGAGGFAYVYEVESQDGVRVSYAMKIMNLKGQSVDKRYLDLLKSGNGLIASLALQNPGHPLLFVPEVYRVERNQFRIQSEQELASPEQDSMYEIVIISPLSRYGNVVDLKTHEMKAMDRINAAYRVLHYVGRELAFLEKKDVVHRDVSPMNILRRANESYGLSDHDGASISGLMEESFLNMRFAAPEVLSQMHDNPMFEPISDVYSLAVSLLYMLDSSIAMDTSLIDPKYSSKDRLARIARSFLKIQEKFSNRERRLGEKTYGKYLAVREFLVAALEPNPHRRSEKIRNLKHVRLFENYKQPRHYLFHTEMDINLDLLAKEAAEREPTKKLIEKRVVAERNPILSRLTQQISTTVANVLGGFEALQYVKKLDLQSVFSHPAIVATDIQKIIENANRLNRIDFEFLEQKLAFGNDLEKRKVKIILMNLERAHPGLVPIDIRQKIENRFPGHAFESVIGLRRFSLAPSEIKRCIFIFRARE